MSQKLIKGSGEAAKGKCYFNPRPKKDIWGRIFVTSAGFGKASYHFLSKDPAGGGTFISNESQPTLKDAKGAPVPVKKLMEKVTWDRYTRFMTAEVNYAEDPNLAYQGQVLKLELQFDEDLSNIESGKHIVIDKMGVVQSTVAYGVALVYRVFALQ